MKKFDSNWHKKEKFVEIDADVFDSLNNQEQKELKSYDYDTSHEQHIDSPITRYTFLLPIEKLSIYGKYTND